ncbi:FkbM family methyltransferase [Aureispira]|nr:FkbM family methyltransferase [Aureispira sp.]
MMASKIILRSIQINFPRQQDFILRVKQSILNFFNKPHEEAFGAIKLFDQQTEKLFLDIGSNRGQSINSMRLFSDDKTKIIAFEANPELSEKLVKRYEKEDSILIHNYGLSSQEGNLELHIPFYKNWMFDGLASFNGNAARGWLKNNILFFKDKFLTIKRVPCMLRKLDDFDLKPYFIKIDVENYEEEVIKGAVNTIKENLPVLLIESLTESAIELLTDLGYHYFVFQKGSFIPREPGYNTFCLNPERHKQIINPMI